MTAPSVIYEVVKTYGETIIVDNPSMIACFNVEVDKILSTSTLNLAS